MQLLKIRDFSALFTDTFQFVKENAQHFFLNFFIFNGLFIILYSGFNAFVLKNATDQNNLPLIVAYVLVIIFLGIIYWVFTPIYMILHQQKGDQFNYNDILNYMTSHIGKIIYFLLISILMSIVIGTALILLSLLLIITIVGIFALPLVFSAFSLWFQLTFMEYLTTDKTYFDAMGYAFSLTTKNFWANVGSNALMQLIIIVLYYLGIALFGLMSAFSEVGTNEAEVLEKMQAMFSSPAFMIIIALMLIASTLVAINAGIVYFSQKESFEKIAAHSSIEELGQEL